MSRYYKMASISKFFCTNCGNEGIPIYRKQGQERKSGHLKKLYCLHCQKECNHVEIKDAGDYDYENFKEEFSLGRFYNGEKQEIKQLPKCSLISCPFNKNGRCWNSNNSAKCKHKPIKAAMINE